MCTGTDKLCSCPSLLWKIKTNFFAILSCKVEIQFDGADCYSWRKYSHVCTVAIGAAGLATIRRNEWWLSKWTLHAAHFAEWPLSEVPLYYIFCTVVKVVQPDHSSNSNIHNLFPLGLNMQAMDTSNVCLVQMELNADSFDPYRCDKNMILGIDLKK